MNVIAYDPFVTDDALFEAGAAPLRSGSFTRRPDSLRRIPATAQDARFGSGNEPLMSMPGGATLVNTGPQAR